MAVNHAQEKGWRSWHNLLAGIPAGQWGRLLRANRWQVDPPYWGRAAFISNVAPVISLLARREERLYGEAVAKVRLTEPPLFVLGHWRSGTTHLHNLLAQDEQFAFPTTLQAVTPFTFLSREKEIRQRLRARTPRTRPMDDMEFGPDTPQEDEFALLLLSLRSPYLGTFSFPRAHRRYDRYLTFRDVPAQEVAEWKETFLHYARKLTYRYGRPLLLKSPTHTARIRILLQLFPDARFVYIHRDPFAVFRSSRHLYETLPVMHHLQRPDEPADEGIFRRYRELQTAYLEERGLVSAGRLHEVRYEDLERDPLRELGRVYEALSLPGFKDAEPRLRRYVDSLAGYRKNRHVELEPESRARLLREWDFAFDAWGYGTARE